MEIYQQILPIIDAICEADQACADIVTQYQSDLVAKDNFAAHAGLRQALIKEGSFYSHGLKHLFNAMEQLRGHELSNH